jgi:protein-tyrosine phosphatase
MSDGAFRVLMVCTGNICRSPVMERLLRGRLAQQLPAVDAARFEISSAGTYAMIGSGIPRESAEILGSMGLDSGPFVSRSLQVEMIAAADLVLAATRDHRSLIVGADPRALSRTLTLREFARLLKPVTSRDIDAAVLDADPVERFRAIVAAGFANRGLVPPGDPAADDIADPYRRGRKAYRRSTAEIDAALGVPLALMFPPAQG